MIYLLFYNEKRKWNERRKKIEDKGAEWVIKEQNNEMC